MIKELLESKEAFVVKFSAEWCAPCKALSIMVNNIEEKVKIVNVDIDSDEGMDLAAEYGIRNVPSMLLFDNGELVARQIGTKSQTEVAAFLNPTGIKQSER